MLRRRLEAYATADIEFTYLVSFQIGDSFYGKSE